MSLILASASPRRQELIRLLTDDFRICPASGEKLPGKYQTPAEYALSMAKSKAQQVSAKFRQPVLGADTVVCLGARIFGKPKDVEDNIAMLTDLSGKWHGVITAIVLCKGGKVIGSDIITTRVLFVKMSPQEISSYARRGEGLDKAGGYGIQGMAGKYIAGIDGCYYNVVGLPVAATADLIRGQI